MATTEILIEREAYDALTIAKAKAELTGKILSDYKNLDYRIVETLRTLYCIAPEKPEGGEE